MRFFRGVVVCLLLIFVLCLLVTVLGLLEGVVLFVCLFLIALACSCQDNREKRDKLIELCRGCTYGYPDGTCRGGYRYLTYKHLLCDLYEKRMER